MKLVFATSNQNKANEIQQLVPDFFQILTLNDINQIEEIPETSDTIEGNAVQKMEYIVTNFGIDCFADDTGLEIESLNGEPGVYSARYAGEEKNAANNMDLVLRKMQGESNRKARFKTVISLSLNGENYLFEGIVNGEIRNEKVGASGFGYDPIFEPENAGKTFAEMNTVEKNQMSHRARAFKKMVDFLTEYNQKDNGEKQQTI
jgi:XTP/dITP diphosphohydrolase